MQQCWLGNTAKLLLKREHDSMCGGVLPPPHPPLSHNHQWGVAMAPSSLLWTLGDGWQHGSQGLSGMVSQTSCWYANMTISQSWYISGQPQGLLSSPAHQDLPLSRDTSQGYSSRLRDCLPQQILGK